MSFLTRTKTELGAFGRYLAMANGDYAAAASLAFSAGRVPVSANLTKAAAASTGGLTWGHETSGLQALHAEIVDSVSAQTIVGALDCRRTPLRTRILSAASGSTAAWISEGGAQQVSELAMTDDTLHPLNLVAMVMLTKEFIASGGPRVEQWIQRELILSISKAIDAAFCDPANAGVPAVKPASIANGAVTINATGGLGTDAGVSALKGDLRDMFSEYRGDWGSAVLVVPTRVAVAAQLAGIPLLAPHGESTIPVLTSGGYPSDGGSPDSDSVMLIDQSAVVSGDMAVTVDATNQADLLVSSGSMNSTGPAAASTVSLFQTGCVAIRAQISTNWTQPPQGRVVVLSGINRD